MGWTLDQVWDMPYHLYEFLVDEVNREAARSRR